MGGQTPCILNICADCDPMTRCPCNPMLPPSRSTSAGHPVALDTELLPLSFLPPSGKETIVDSLCPDDCALRVMHDILLQRSPQRRLPKQNQFRQAFLFDRSHPPFRMRVQIRTPRWQAKRLHASRFDHFTKRSAELRIAVMQRIAAASQSSPLLHGHVSCRLLHPFLIRVRRESCQAHPATLQVDEEQHIGGHQSFQC